jgi:hypothetical protein
VIPIFMREGFAFSCCDSMAGTGDGCRFYTRNLPFTAAKA